MNGGVSACIFCLTGYFRIKFPYVITNSHAMKIYIVK